jgi:hypothetical protein
MKADSQKDTTLPPIALLDAVNSLYDDELKPTLGLLRRRLKELYDVYLPAQDVRKLVQVFVEANIMRVNGCENDLEVMLTSRPSGSLVDPMDPDEPYDPEIFQRMQVFMDVVAAVDPDRLYRGGRYGMAQQLRSVEMPELRRFSLGRVCHIVQRAIERKIVGYRKRGSLAPYRLSDAFLKSTEESHYLLQADLPTIKTMAELRAALTMLWMNPKHHQGVALSQVKDELKQSAKRSLSEHLLGYGKLSQLFTAPELAGSCDLFFECHDVLLFPPILLSANEVFAPRTRTGCTPASSCCSLTAPRLEGSSDLSHECHDVLLYPPYLVSAKEHCATPSTTCSSLSDDSSRGPFARGRYTERARTGCAPIPSRTSSRKVPAPAASETSSVTGPLGLELNVDKTAVWSPDAGVQRLLPDALRARWAETTFASSKVSNISSVPTADGLASVQAPGLQVPSPLLLPDLFNMPPPLLPGVPFVNALCLDVPEMLRWDEMVHASLQLTLAMATVQRESLT